MKTCAMCSQTKNFSEFRPNRYNKDGYNSYCFTCQKEYNKKYREKVYVRKHPKEKIIGDTKHCTQCKEYKPLSEFKTDKSSWCKPCHVEYDRKRNEKSLTRPRKYINDKMHCRECGEYLTKDNFTLRKHTNTRCDSCQIVYQHKRTVKKHGITYERYLEMYESQGGKCKICQSVEKSYKSRLSIDHDHTCCPGYNSCGKCVRGLLCSNCNTFLGNAKDSVEILQKAIEYLQSI